MVPGLPGSRTAGVGCEVTDSRKQQALALIDDARTLMQDLKEEGLTPGDFARVDSTQRLLNSATTQLKAAFDE